jgi:hypothetical protein
MYYLLFLCILIYIYIIYYIGKIFYNLYKLNNDLNKNNTIIIFNRPIRYNIYRLMSLLIENICYNTIYDINEYNELITYFKKNINNNINIILDSTGGDIVSNDNLINFILNSKIKLNIFILNKAKSAATLLALSANKLYMDKYATLGPTDPQITFDDIQYSLRSLINLCENKDKNYISDKMLITYYDSLNLYDENVNLIKKLLNNNSKLNNKYKKTYNKFINNFTYGSISHHSSFNVNYLNKYINIYTDIPKYITNIYNDFNYIYQLL